MAIKKKQVVFEDDDSEEPITLSVNESYRKTFEEKERKREISYLTSKGLLDDDDDSQSSESSEDEMSDEEATSKLDKMLSKVMTSIRKKDPKIFDKNEKWFDEEDDDEEEGGGSANKKDKKKRPTKKMTYKDVVREQILEDAETLGFAKPTLNDDEEDDDDNVNYDQSLTSSKKSLAYDAEQKKLRQAFLAGLQEEDDGENSNDDANGSGDGDGSGLAVVKKKEKRSKANDGDDVSSEDDDEEEAEFSDGGGDATDKFLKDFLVNKRWQDTTNIIGDDDSDDEDGVDDDEDLEEVDAMEAFESKYNFRFEEEEANRRQQLGEGTDDGMSNIAPSMRGLLGEANETNAMQVRSYSRSDVAGTLRRKDEKRKLDRQTRKERKANEKLKIEEELRRLKNLKKKEIERKLKEISDIGGIDDIDPSMLEGDFDPDTFDAAMQSAFGEAYYAEAGDDVKKMKHEVADGEDDDDEEEEADDDETSTRKTTTKHKVNPEREEWSKSISKAGAEAKKLMEDIQQYEYDDIIDDTPTRFRYTSVQPESYGLTTDEILAADDNALNAFVSLKKVAAPYGYSSVPVNAKKRKKFRESLKQRQAELAEVTIDKDGEVKKKRKRRRGKHGKKEEGDDDDDEGGDDGRGEYERDEGGDAGDYEENGENADVVVDKIKSKDESKKRKDENNTKQPNEGTVSSSSSSSGGGKKARRSNHQNKTEKGKQKKQNKNESSGVSASRLASYGIL